MQRAKQNLIFHLGACDVKPISDCVAIFILVVVYLKQTGNCTKENFTSWFVLKNSFVSTKWICVVKNNSFNLFFLIYFVALIAQKNPVR